MAIEVTAFSKLKKIKMFVEARSRPKGLKNTKNKKRKRPIPADDFKVSFRSNSYG